MSNRDKEKGEGGKEVEWRGREGKKQLKEAGGPSRRVQSRLHSSLLNSRSSSPRKPLNFEGNPWEREENYLLQSQMGQPQGSTGHRRRSNDDPKRMHELVLNEYE